MTLEKAKTLLTKAKKFDGVMLTKHDTDQEKHVSKQKMKKLIDHASNSKEFVICLFEV